MRNAKRGSHRHGGNLGLGEVFGEAHPHNVQSVDILVQPKCAVSARAAKFSGCDHRRMGKAHPRRPHLKAWREHMDRTQEWLANEIGTSHSTVLRAEKQETGVDDRTFEAIAKAYGITVAELTAAPADREKAQAMDRLLRVVRDMDGPGVALIAGFAERLKP